MAAGLDESVPSQQKVRVQLLGPFAIALDDRFAGPWQRPSARRLCALVMVSPGRRVTRDRACEDLFADLEPRAAARSVSKALSMARSTLAGLGDGASALLDADLEHIWASPVAEIDAEAHEQALRAGLAMPPGLARDEQLTTALRQDGDLLADEPYADWAQRPRERLAALRQEARLALARDRAKGAGRSGPEAVSQAWEACFEHDLACEEAASALVRAYFAQGNREAAARTYQRCVAALRELGLATSPSLDQVYAVAASRAASSRSAASDPLAADPDPRTEEVRTISVFSAGVSAPAGLAGKLGLEAGREIISSSVTALITEIEALGGTVTSVSGGGLQAMFGAPEANEDDPERALRAAFRAMSAARAAADVGPVLRIGVETGQAVLGPVGAGTRVEYTAIGDVVETATALQSAARPGSVLVGPVTHAATRHLFTWGGDEAVAVSDGRRVSSRYLGDPRVTAASRARAGIGPGPLAGRGPEVAALDAAVHEALAGRGAVVVLTGEAGLGKTRLVQEARARSAVRPGTARRPARLWLEGRCASYASATPYGLYQQVLANWIGVAPDQPDAKLRPALASALAGLHADALLPPLARVLGLPGGAAQEC